MEATKIRKLIESTRALADELEAMLEAEGDIAPKPAVTYDPDLEPYDPLRAALRDADVRDKATRDQKNRGILMLFSTLYAINQRQRRGLGGSELRDLVHSVGYSDLRSLNRWEDNSMGRDADGFRWVTARGHREWIVDLSSKLRIGLPADLMAWVEPPVTLQKRTTPSTKA